MITLFYASNPTISVISSVKRGCITIIIIIINRNAKTATMGRIEFSGCLARFIFNLCQQLEKFAASGERKRESYTVWLNRGWYGGRGNAFARSARQFGRLSSSIIPSLSHTPFYIFLFL